MNKWIFRLYLWNLCSGLVQCYVSIYKHCLVEAGDIALEKLSASETPSNIPRKDC